jgi:hypothetical protein
MATRIDAGFTLRIRLDPPIRPYHILRKLDVDVVFSIRRTYYTGGAFSVHGMALAGTELGKDVE